MKKSPFRLFGAILAFFLLSGTCLAVDMDIMTGSTKGTYYQFGLNLRRLAQQNGIDLHVVSSNGSVENIYSVYKRPHTQLGIVQSDVLAFVSRVHTDPTLKRIAAKIKMVFPLYNEEIHLIGKTDIRDFNDLSGRRVAIGKEGSGTYLTTKLLFKLTGITPAESLETGVDQALALLKKDRIDAMFFVAGLPVRLFNENITPEDNLKIIPITNSKAVEFYPKTIIPAGSYSWQTEPVDTIAIKAVLVSFNFRNYYCEQVGRMAKILFENMDWLMQNGHPKWKTVDLDFPLKGWEQYDCVRKKLRQVKKIKIQREDLNPVLKAIKEML